MNIPIFFDRFGIIVWIALIVDAVLQYRNKQRHWRVWAELALGIIGLIVDGGMVFGHELGWLCLGC